MTLIAAVTGGIGAGKSTVAAELARLGAVVVDSDRLAREVVAPGSEGLAEVVAAFGPEVAPAGVLDRAALAAIVFADPAARARLEAITHPRVRRRFAELAAAAPADAVVVNDIPLLVDLSAAAAFHLVVGVHADPAVRVARLVGRGLPESDARARIAAQIDDRRRRELCDVWLANDGPAEEIGAAVRRLWADRLVPFRDNLGTATAVLGPVPRESVDRVRARVARAVGGDPVVAVGDHLVVAAPDAAGVADRVRRLGLAGFPAVAAADDGPRCGAADPGCPADIRVRLTAPV